MTSVLPELEGSMSIKERRQLLLQKGLSVGGQQEQQESKPSSSSSLAGNTTTNKTIGRSSSIHKANVPLPTSLVHDNNTSTPNIANNESFSSIKDRIKLLDKKPSTITESPSSNYQLLPTPQTFVPTPNTSSIPQPPPSLPSSSITNSYSNTTPQTNNTNITNNTTPINHQPYIPPPPSSLFSFDEIKELHRDEYEEFEYQLKQTELELEASNPNTQQEEGDEEHQPEYTIPSPNHSNIPPPTSFQLDGKNRKTLIVGSSSSYPSTTSAKSGGIVANNSSSSTLSINSGKNLPPTSTSRNNQINNNSMVISNNLMMKERNVSPPSSMNTGLNSNSTSSSNTFNNIGGNLQQQTSPINQMYHYPIKVQTTSNNSGKSDEVQYPSAPSFDEIDFPEYQIVNNVQMQTMTSNIFKPITDSLSEVSEEEDYRMFTQFKEFITSQRGPVMTEEKLYSLYISFRERYQKANVNNVNNNKQQSPTVVLVNKSRVPTVSGTKAKPIVNPNSPTVSTTSGSSSTNSSGSNSEKKRDGLRDVRKKYEEQKLEEMRIKQMKERNKAHFAQEMQQPCMDYNALVMRENAMYNMQSNPQQMNGNNYPTINNPNDVISNGAYIPFKASHPQQSNSHITSRAISNSTGAGYLNYNNNNYWPNNK